MSEQTREQHSTLLNLLYRHRFFMLVLACYLIASTYLAFRLAPLSGPDEAAHYHYITYIRDFGDVPPKFKRDEPRTKRLEPPAYYTLVAIAASPFDDGRRPEFALNPFYATTPRGNQNPVLGFSRALIAARLATVAFGVLGLIGLYVGVAQWLGVRLGGFVAALLAFQPSYITFSATLNNDIAVVCVGLWFLAAVIGIVLHGGSPLKTFGLGALWGVALLMQSNALVLGLALPIVWLSPNNRPKALRAMMDSLAGCAVFYGPWFLNRLILSGPFDSAPAESFAITPARPTFYVGLLFIFIATAAAWFLTRKPREAKPAFFKKPGLASRLAPLPILALATFAFAQLFFRLTDAQPEARTITLAQLPATAAQTHLRYGPDQSIELAAIESPSATQGHAIDVPLYWRTLKSPSSNYAIHAQLLIPNGPQTAQLDEQTSYPGHGTSLTSDWREGDLIADTITFYPKINIVLNGPTRAIIVLNLLQLPVPPTQTLTTTLPVWQDGVAVDFPSAQAITVRPEQPLSFPSEFVLATSPQFGDGIGDKIALAAFSARWADDKLHLTLWWQAMADVSADLTLFAHVLNADGKLIAQSDGLPNAGLSPTQFWRKGDVIRDEREIAVTQQLGLTLALGFYDSASQERVSASQAGKPLPDNLLRLSLP